jgi:hypothetical protein
VCEQPAAQVVRIAMESALGAEGAACEGAWVLTAENDGLAVT